jgi:hypothetical protein
MSSSGPTDRASGPDGRRRRLRAYLRRFFTSWIAEDPDPTYSTLDRGDGLGQVPDPVCQPRTQLPESAEVTEHVWSADRTRSTVGGRHSQ